MSKSNQHLVLMVKIVATAKDVDVVKAELVKLVEPTRKETGCLLYELVQSTEQQSTFYMLETWQSPLLWEQHKDSIHLRNFNKQTDGLITEFVVDKLYKSASSELR